MRKQWPMWLVTFGGAGLLKPAPGTWGSAAAVLVLAVAWRFQTAGEWPFFLAVFLVIASALNVMLGPWIVRTMGEDPGACVIDEAAGIALTLIGLPMFHPVATFLCAFVLFRIFDVSKIPPAKQLEELPAGWGILFDDLAAAVYANIACQCLLRLL